MQIIGLISENLTNSDLECRKKISSTTLLFLVSKISRKSSSIAI